MTSETLLANVDNLAEQSHIRSMLDEAAPEVRLTRSDMVHGDFVTTEITEDDADEMLGLVEDSLREMFEPPTRVQRRSKASHRLF